MRDVDWEREVASLGVSHRHVSEAPRVRHCRREGGPRLQAGTSIDLPDLRGLGFGRHGVLAARRAHRLGCLRAEAQEHGPCARGGGRRGSTAPRAAHREPQLRAAGSTRCSISWPRIAAGAGVCLMQMSTTARYWCASLETGSTCATLRPRPSPTLCMLVAAGEELRQVRKLARWLSTEEVDAALLAGEAAAAAAAAAAPAPAPLHADPLTLPIHMRERATRTTPPILFQLIASPNILSG